MLELWFLFSKKKIVKKRKKELWFHFVAVGGLGISTSCLMRHPDRWMNASLLSCVLVASPKKSGHVLVWKNMSFDFFNLFVFIFFSTWEINFGRSLWKAYFLVNRNRIRQKEKREKKRYLFISIFVELKNKMLTRKNNFFHHSNS